MGLLYFTGFEMGSPEFIPEHSYSGDGITVTTGSKRTGSHSDRIAVYDGGTALFQQWKDIITQEDGTWEATFRMVFNLAAGSHTIKIRHNASSSTAAVTWNQALLTVDQVP